MPKVWTSIMGPTKMRHLRNMPLSFPWFHHCTKRLKTYWWSVGINNIWWVPKVPVWWIRKTSLWCYMDHRHRFPANKSKSIWKVRSFLTQWSRVEPSWGELMQAAHQPMDQKLVDHPKAHQAQQLITAGPSPITKQWIHWPLQNPIRRLFLHLLFIDNRGLIL